MCSLCLFPQREPAALHYNGTFLEPPAVPPMTEWLSFSPVQVWARGAYHNGIGRMHQCSQLIEIILSLDRNKREGDGGERDREREKWLAQQFQCLDACKKNNNKIITNHTSRKTSQSLANRQHIES